MAKKSTNKTIWTLALVAILGFLAYKLWPAIRNKINGGGGSSGGGGAVGGIPGGYNPYGGSGQQGGGGSLSGGLAPSNNNSGGGGGNFLSNWINNVLIQGWQNAANIDGPDSYGTILASDASALYGLDEQGLPLEPTDFGDQSQFLVTSPYDSGSSYDDETIDQMTGDEGEDYSFDDINGYSSGDYGNSYGGEETIDQSYDPNTAYWS